MTEINPLDIEFIQDPERLAGDLSAIITEGSVNVNEVAKKLISLGYGKLVKKELAPLKSYSSGERVMVLDRKYKWVHGVISEVSPAGVHVETETGPVTIGSPSRINKA